MQLKFEMVLQDHCRKKKNHALLFKRTGDKYFCLTVSVLESLSRGLGWRSEYETWPSHSVVFFSSILQNREKHQFGDSYLIQHKIL